MTKVQIRELIACAIAGVDPAKGAISMQALEEGSFYSRADAVLTVLDGVRDSSRKAAIEEIARDYHEAMAAKLNAKASSDQLFVEAMRLRTLAEMHRSCAKEVREQVWKQPPSEAATATAGAPQRLD